MHKSQVLSFFLAAFLIGVFFASFIHFSWTWILSLLMLAIVIIAVSGYKKTFGPKGGPKRKRGLLIGFTFLFFILGLGRYSAFQYGHTLIVEFNDRDSSITVRGYIASELDNNGTKTRFTFRVKEIITSRISIPVDENILVQTDIFPPKKFGEYLDIHGMPQKPKNFSNFDYVTYLKKEGIRSVVFFPSVKKIENLDISFIEKTKLIIFRRLFSIKNGFQNKLQTVLKEPHSEYINGILLGVRQNIPVEIKEAFNRTGTTHVLALSGFNITIIADALLIALTQFVRRRKAFWISTTVIVLFTIMVGAGASIVRAAIMGLILLFAQSYGRIYSPHNAILMAAAIMIWLNPFILIHDIGFQLSFFAVMGIIMFHPIFSKKMEKLPDRFKIKENLLMTLSAQVFVIPLLMFYFQQFSIVSLPSNILILPLMPLAMLFGFLSGIGGYIFVPLGQALGIFATVISGYQLGIVKWFSSFKYASLNIPINIYVLLIAYILILWYYLRQRKIYEN